MLLVLPVPVGLSSHVWCQNTEYFHCENSKDSHPVYSVSSILLRVFVWRKSQAVVHVRSWEEICVQYSVCKSGVCVYVSFYVFELSVIGLFGKVWIVSFSNFAVSMVLVNRFACWIILVQVMSFLVRSTPVIYLQITMEKLLRKLSLYLFHMLCFGASEVCAGVASDVSF